MTMSGRVYTTYRLRTDAWCDRKSEYATSLDAELLMINRDILLVGCNYAKWRGADSEGSGSGGQRCHRHRAIRDPVHERSGAAKRKPNKGIIRLPQTLELCLRHPSESQGRQNYPHNQSQAGVSPCFPHQPFPSFRWKSCESARRSAGTVFWESPNTVRSARIPRSLVGRG